MNYTLTTTLSWKFYNFLNQQSTLNKTTKKAIIEEALGIYQKQKLKEQIEKWLDNRYSEYKEINNDFANIQFNSLKS